MTELEERASLSNVIHITLPNRILMAPQSHFAIFIHNYVYGFDFLFHAIKVLPTHKMPSSQSEEILNTFSEKEKKNLPFFILPSFCLRLLVYVTVGSSQYLEQWVYRLFQMSKIEGRTDN